VIETFIIDWPILAFFGFWFGGASARVGTLRALIAGLIPTAGFTASAMLSYNHAPDWMWMYYRDPDEMEPVVRWMPQAYVAAFLLSFWSALRMERSGLRSARALSLGAEAAVVAATWDRYHRIGTKEEWAAGTADELVALKPEGKAKQISTYVPLVVGTIVAGGLIAWSGRASSARR
jgi:hypothetical protein